MPETPRQNELLSLSNQELTGLVQKLGEPPFRARQLADAIFRQRKESISEASNLPATLKSRLAKEGFEVGFPRLEQKFTST
jgi:23S rRNA (adenine2503-C2)-methyltransferase